jgi:4-hydroxy-4-methyl-2-oxoglutarate aldolase
MTIENATIYRDIPRTHADSLARLHGLSVADLHDALPPTARSAGLLDQSIRPITPGLRSCGRAITAFCAPGDSLMTHCALYLARPGDVLIISNGGVPNGALWGGNVSFDAKAFGLAGAVVDGPVRDVAFNRELQYPLWASSVSVSRAEKKGHGYVNLPVSCGGRIVNPGDIVVADDDGVLVFSPEHIEVIVDQVRSRSRDEAEMHRRISAGERLFDTQNFAQLLKDKGIAIQDGDWRSEPASPL